MESLKEDIDVLHELIRKAYDLIAPFKYHDNLEVIMKKNMRKPFIEKFPKCWIMLKNDIGREIPFHICNRIGLEDPKIIDFSLKLANKFRDKPEVDQDRLNVCVKKLIRLKNKFSREVPRPAPEAARKGKETRNMNKIKQYLKDLK
jgi:hypothetical protein